MSEIGRTPSKLGFPSFLFKAAMKPCFAVCGYGPDAVISFKITDKGFERKSLKAQRRRNGISKGQTLVFRYFSNSNFSEDPGRLKSIRSRLLHTTFFYLGIPIFYFIGKQFFDLFLVVGLSRFAYFLFN